VVLRASYLDVGGEAAMVALSVMLSPQERETFARYCEEETFAIEGLATQMESTPGNVIDTVIKHYRLRAAAYALVAKDMRGIEEMKL